MSVVVAQTDDIPWAAQHALVTLNDIYECRSYERYGDTVAFLEEFDQKVQPGVLSQSAYLPGDSFMYFVE